LAHNSCHLTLIAPSTTACWRSGPLRGDDDTRRPLLWDFRCSSPERVAVGAWYQPSDKWGTYDIFVGNGGAGGCAVRSFAGGPGTGAGAHVVVATLSGAPSLAAADIWLV